jgi:succinate dehydrogenase / fumarate reductase cytochrome b subunit
MSATSVSSPVSGSVVPIRRTPSFLASTVGMKVIMAVTGAILFAFVVGHMIGNLQVFLGAEALDHYAVFLRQFLHGAGLWIARVVLLASVGLHIWSATVLTLASWAARPVGYRRVRHEESTYASRTMRWGGPLLAIFVVYHIMHLTLGRVGLPFQEGNVYQNVVAGFRIVPLSLFYIVAQLALGLHLYHGGWSMLQTLGLSHARWNRLRFGLSLALTLVVVIGNTSIPVAVLAGWVR